MSEEKYNYKNIHEFIYEKYKDYVEDKANNKKIIINVKSMDKYEFYDKCSDIVMTLLQHKDIKLLAQPLEIKLIDLSEYIYLSYTPISDKKIDVRLIFKHKIGDRYKLKETHVVFKYIKKKESEKND